MNISLTRKPPVSNATFQFKPKSLRLIEVLSLYKMGITKEGVFLVNVEEVMCELVHQIIEYWKKRWGERGDQVVVEWEIFHTTPLLGAFTNDLQGR